MLEITLADILSWLIPIVATSMLGYILKRYEEGRTAEKQEREQLTHQIEVLNKKIEAQELMVKELVVLAGKIDELDKRLERLENADQCLLRDRLLQSCTYFIRAGDIPVSVKFALSNMYKAYTELNGNDVVTGVYQKMMRLPEVDNGEIW